MNINKFTIKAQEAIQEAVNIATSNGQQVIEPVHLMGGVMKSSEQILSFLLQKTGVNIKKLGVEVNDAIRNLPKVSGGEPYLSHSSNQVLTKAEDIALKNGDEFVSVEPLLLALLAEKSSAADILKNNGVTKNELEKAIEELRKGEKVTSQSAEESYQALSKYAINLNDAAKSGKLEPVYKF